MRSVMMVATTLLLASCGGGSGDGDPLVGGDNGNQGGGVVETPLQQALRTGDARLLDDNQVVLDAALQNIQASVSHFDDIKSALFGRGNQALTQLSWNPSHDSSLLQSQYPFNDVVLYTNSTFQEGNQVRQLPIAIAGNGSTLSDD
ncbi:MAG: hypothetical protein AAFN68_03645, partial [Pseudomonadota bacterium]